MEQTTLAALQQRMLERGRQSHADDTIKLASIELWLDAMRGEVAKAERRLLDLEIHHDTVGFAGSDPEIAARKARFAQGLAELLGHVLMAANAAGVDLQDAMQRQLQPPTET